MYGSTKFHRRSKVGKVVSQSQPFHVNDRFALLVGQHSTLTHDYDILIVFNGFRLCTGPLYV